MMATAPRNDPKQSSGFDSIGEDQSVPQPGIEPDVPVQSPEFMRRLVHEVRAPTHAISITLSMLTEAMGKLDLPDEALEAFNLLTSTSEEMRCTMRSLARYVHTLDAVEPKSLDIDKRIDDVWDKLSRVLPNAPIFTNTVKPFSLAGDDRLFDLAVECVLENAIKFRSPEGPSRINVTSTFIDGDQLISFSDNGIGIEAEYLEKCYKPFERLFPRALYPGAGLGIPTAMKSLVHMNGTVELESSPDGTIVFFRFKL